MTSKKPLRKNIQEAQKLSKANPQKTTVRQYFGPFGNSVSGDKVGIEVEVESSNNYLPLDKVNTNSSFWRAINDGSLRDASGLEPGGREYVSKTPTPFSDVPAALEELDGFLSNARCKIRASNRCSVHVHCNVQDWTLAQLVSLFVLYYMVEPLLGRFNGYERANNLHAIQAIQSPHLVHSLVEFLGAGGSFIPSGPLKYSALNWAPLGGVFGTVEFRQGKGIEKSPMEIIPWIELIQELYNTAKTFSHPTHILQGISSRGPLSFLQETLPKIMEACSSLYDSEEELESIIYSSMRNSQALCYDIDWSDYEPEAGQTTEKKPPYTLEELSQE